MSPYSNTHRCTPFSMFLSCSRQAFACPRPGKSPCPLGWSLPRRSPSSSWWGTSSRSNPPVPPHQFEPHGGLVPSSAHRAGAGQSLRPRHRLPTNTMKSLKPSPLCVTNVRLAEQRGRVTARAERAGVSGSVRTGGLRPKERHTALPPVVKRKKRADFHGLPHMSLNDPSLAEGSHIVT